MRDFLIITVVGLCAVRALGRPYFGFLAFVFFSIMNPHSFAWGPARGLPFALLLAISTLFGWFVSRERHVARLHREGGLLLALWILFCLTTLFALEPERARLMLKYVSKILLMVFLSLALVNTRERLRTLAMVIGLTLGFFSLKSGVWFILTRGQYMVFGPEGSFLESNNSFGLALAVNFPILWYLLKDEKRRWLRRLMWAMVLFSFPAVLGTFSRGAWIALAVSVAYVVYRSGHRWTLVFGVCCAVVVALPFMPDRVRDRYDDLVNYQEEGAVQSRFASWTFATKVALAHPVLGAGFDYYSQKAYKTYYPEFLKRYPTKVWSCHSVWFTMLSEHGFTGIILYLSLLGCLLGSLRKLRREARGSPERHWTGAYAHMLEAGILTFMVAGTFFDAAYFDLSFQLFAMVIMLKELATKVPDRAPENEPVAEPVAVSAGAGG